LKLAIARTQWRSQNVFMLSLIWEKRSIPLYWLLLDKKGSCNIGEQKALIIPVLELLSDYKIIMLGDREFGSIKLTDWLCEKKVKFIFRVKQGRYIQEKNSDYIFLSNLGYGQKKIYLSDIKVTKQQGFRTFDIAAYWSRKYREKQDDVALVSCD